VTPRNPGADGKRKNLTGKNKKKVKKENSEDQRPIRASKTKCAWWFREDKGEHEYNLPAIPFGRKTAFRTSGNNDGELRPQVIRRRTKRENVNSISEKNAKEKKKTGSGPKKQKRRSLFQKKGGADRRLPQKG